MTWRRSLEAALAGNGGPESRFVQLATVRPDGLPANRTLVFRGFAPGSDDLLFTADRRSEKMQEILHQPLVEACWYFVVSREQFRLAGPIDPCRESVEPVWKSLSSATRRQFFWPHPGQDRSADREFQASEEQLLRPPENLAVLRLSPRMVERLCLALDPPERTRFTLADGVWLDRRLNP